MVNLVIFTCWINPVRKEQKQDSSFRVSPRKSSCKTTMSKTCIATHRGRIGFTISWIIPRVWFIKTIAPPVIRFLEMPACPFLQGRSRQITVAAIITEIQVHLHHFRRIVYGSKQAGVARNSTQNCCRFIMYKTLQLHFSKCLIELSWIHLINRFKQIRSIGKRISTKRMIEDIL